MKSIVFFAAISSMSLVMAGDVLAATHGGARAMAQPAGVTSSSTQAAKSTTLGPTHPTGQPNQTCGSATAPNTPGNAAAAPGSAFNPSGTAGGVYAGEQPQNSRNVASVSQYDVACAHQR